MNKLKISFGVIIATRNIFNFELAVEARKKELAQRKSIMNLPMSARTPTCSQLYSTIQTILDADSSRVTKMLGEYQLPPRGGTRGRKLRLAFHVLDMYKVLGLPPIAPLILID